MELDRAACDRARLARDARFDGRLFIGVVTTGVYCRPICPSPVARRKNVRYFPSAAAAVEAGFRPCLRCRPETAPGTSAWNGTSATVSRALRLIAEGGLDGRSVADLSGRLGVSSRHLLRLFTRHLGASPLAVAQTRRLNCAKQLISDTHLPLSQVALASGYQSVRRFNESLARLWGRTPSELRRLRPAPPAGPEEYVFRLAYRPPYDWEALLQYLSARATPGVETVVAGAYRRTFALAGRHGLLEIRHDRRGRALEARIRFPEPLALLSVVARVRAMFDLAADPSTIAAHFRGDPLLGPLVREHPGLRVPGAWDGFELAVRAILGQQVTVAGASTLAGRLARQFGEPLSLEGGGGLSLVFPTAPALARAELAGLPGVRAGAIRGLAEAVAAGRVVLSGAVDPALPGLASIRGVGEWTAQYVALRALGDPDAFPSGDSALLRVAGGSERLEPRALLRLAERWRPWRAYAAIHLWRAAADRHRGREAPKAMPRPVQDRPRTSRGREARA